MWSGDGRDFEGRGRGGGAVEADDEARGLGHPSWVVYPGRHVEVYDGARTGGESTVLLYTLVQFASLSRPRFHYI